MTKLWQKNDSEPISGESKKIESFTVGNDYILDSILLPYDVKGSIVHAMALEKAGVINHTEFSKLRVELENILEAWENGRFEIRQEDEDMHTAIENHLTGKLGDLGMKIHAGRSRNDQILTAMRLYEKENLSKIIEMVKQTALMLINFGHKYEYIPIAGFTHTRKAMLSSLGLWSGGFAELLILQAEASYGIMNSINRSPLGTAAGFGTTFKIDREFEAQKLGFEGLLICSTSAQLSRGLIELQLVQYLCGITSVLNRLSSDVIQYSSDVYRFFDLDEKICTGSSIMPQKKNPDVAELIRGGHSVMLGYAASLQALTQNLISGYHRDLQLTKEPVISAIKKTTELLEVTMTMVESIAPDADACKASCTAEIFAAEKANKMVIKEGISFREAYKIASMGIDYDFHEELIRIEYDNNAQIGSIYNTGLDRLIGRIDQT